MSGMGGVEMRYKHAMILINGKSPAEILQERIRKEGTQLWPNGTTLKLHAFINHQVDCHLMSICGQHLAYRFRGLGANKIIAPRSGVLLAQCCAIHLRVPLVIATTVAPVTSARDIKIYSQTRKGGGQYMNDVALHISSEFIGPSDRVLLIDDVMSSGATANVLMQIISEAGAQLVGFGLMIAKEFDGGRPQVYPRWRLQMGFL
jgi:xanthine phosphoribosyltransferase